MSLLLCCKIAYRSFHKRIDILSLTIDRNANFFLLKCVKLFDVNSVCNWLCVSF